MTHHSAIQQALLERMTGPVLLQDGTYSANITFDRNFPGFDGHFPGNPIVPAICQLSALELLAKCALNNGTLRTRKIASMKCRTPLMPDDTATFSFTILQNDDGTVTASAAVHTQKQRNSSKIKLILE